MTDTSTLLWNPFDPAFRADPYPFYDRLRTEAPAYPVPGGSTVLTRYSDVFATLRSNQVSRDIEANAIFDFTKRFGVGGGFEKGSEFDTAQVFVRFNFGPRG